jgi:hypothetical protein
VRRLPPDGLEAWKRVIERGYEGYVAKDEASVYEGGATRWWLKVKMPGWTVGENRWRRRIFGVVWGRLFIVIGTDIVDIMIKDRRARCCTPARHSPRCLT